MLLGCRVHTYEAETIILAIPAPNLTSMGLMDAAATLIKTSSGSEMVGTGSVAVPYSEGLLYLARASAFIVVAISVAMIAIQVSRSSVFDVDG